MSNPEKVGAVYALARQEIVTLTERLDILSSFLGQLSPQTPLTYRVEVTSAWPRELNARASFAGSLYDVMRSAADEFMLINHRHDVQGTYGVWAQLDSTNFLVIPHVHWVDVELKILLEQEEKHQPSMLMFCAREGIPV